MELNASRRVFLAVASSAAVAALAVAATVSPAAAAPAAPQVASPIGAALADRACPPSALAVNFSDSLDKLNYHGATLGGWMSSASPG